MRLLLGKAWAEQGSRLGRLRQARRSDPACSLPGVYLALCRHRAPAPTLRCAQNPRAGELPPSDSEDEDEDSEGAPGWRGRGKNGRAVLACCVLGVAMGPGGEATCSCYLQNTLWASGGQAAVWGLAGAGARCWPGRESAGHPTWRPHLRRGEQRRGGGAPAGRACAGGATQVRGPGRTGRQAGAAPLAHTALRGGARATGWQAGAGGRSPPALPPAGPPAAAAAAACARSSI